MYVPTSYIIYYSMPVAVIYEYVRVNRKYGRARITMRVLPTHRVVCTLSRRHDAPPCFRRLIRRLSRPRSHTRRPIRYGPKGMGFSEPRFTGKDFADNINHYYFSYYYVRISTAASYVSRARRMSTDGGRMTRCARSYDVCAYI